MKRLRSALGRSPERCPRLPSPPASHSSSFARCSSDDCTPAAAVAERLRGPAPAAQHRAEALGAGESDWGLGEAVTAWPTSRDFTRALAPAPAPAGSQSPASKRALRCAFSHAAAPATADRAMAAAARTLAAACCWMAVAAPLINALIIPQELPTILSVLYSNIPPILKGTDSRLGLGFRFGPHADFQVLLELGPQTYTKKLGPDADAEAEETKRRRQAPRPPAMLPSLPPLLPVLADPAYDSEDATAPDTVGSRWLSAWRSGLVNPSKNTFNIQQHPATIKKMNYPEENDVMSHLTTLYKNDEKPTAS